MTANDKQVPVLTAKQFSDWAHDWPVEDQFYDGIACLASGLHIVIPAAELADLRDTSKAYIDLHKEMHDVIDNRDKQLAELRLKLEDANDDYLRRHKDACDRYDEVIVLRAQLAEAQSVISICAHALRAPIDDWKGEVERKALDAIARAKQENGNG